MTCNFILSNFILVKRELSKPNMLNIFSVENFYMVVHVEAYLFTCPKPLRRHLDKGASGLDHFSFNTLHCDVVILD